MDIGRNILAKVLDEPGALGRFIEEGFDLAWIADKADLSRAAIFGDTDVEPYRFILKAWEKTGQAPSREYFEHSFPPQSLRLPKEVMDLDELVAMAQEDRTGVQLHLTLSTSIDLHDEGRYEEALALMEAEAKRIRRTGDGGKRLTLTPVSAIKSRPVRWLWEDRFPLSHLSLAVGKPDLGKSQFAVWLAAQISRGQLPGHFKGDPRGVIYVATEDSFEETIRPRLEAAGADLDRVFRVDSTEQPGKGFTLSLSARDIAEMAGLITGDDVALVVFDPLVSVVGGTSWNKAEEVRAALVPLAEMLQETRCSAVGLMHFRKEFSEDILTQIAGSGAWSQIVRAAVAFAIDPDAEDEKTVIMSQAKNNLGRGGLPSLTFTFRPVEMMTEEGTTHVSRIEWGAESAWSVEDLLNNRNTDKARTALDRCIEWLASYLGDGTPVLIDDVMTAGKETSWNTATRLSTAPRRSSRSSLSEPAAATGRVPGDSIAHDPEAEKPGKPEISEKPRPGRLSRFRFLRYLNKGGQEKLRNRRQMYTGFDLAGREGLRCLSPALASTRSTQRTSA